MTNMADHKPDALFRARNFLERAASDLASRNSQSTTSQATEASTSPASAARLSDSTAIRSSSEGVSGQGTKVPEEERSSTVLLRPVAVLGGVATASAGVLSPAEASRLNGHAETLAHGSDYLTDPRWALSPYAMDLVAALVAKGEEIRAELAEERYRSRRLVESSEAYVAELLKQIDYFKSRERVLTKDGAVVGSRRSKGAVS